MQTKHLLKIILQHSVNLVTLYLLLQVPIEWEEVTVTPILLPDGKTTIPPAAINSMNKNKIGLKGN